jgi:hypothetical protein
MSFSTTAVTGISTITLQLIRTGNYVVSNDFAANRSLFNSISRQTVTVIQQVPILNTFCQICIGRWLIPTSDLQTTMAKAGQLMHGHMVALGQLTGFLI